MNFRIPVRVKSRIFLVNPAEIDFIEAAGNYVRLHTGEESYLVRGTISAFEQRLSPMGFIRVHRSTLANMAFVSSLQSMSSGDYAIHLATGRSVTLSRTYRENFFAVVNSRAQAPQPTALPEQASEAR